MRHETIHAVATLRAGGKTGDDSDAPRGIQDDSERLHAPENNMRSPPPTPGALSHTPSGRLGREAGGVEPVKMNG